MNCPLLSTFHLYPATVPSRANNKLGAVRLLFPFRSIPPALCLCPRPIRQWPGTGKDWLSRIEYERLFSVPCIWNARGRQLVYREYCPWRNIGMGTGKTSNVMEPSVVSLREERVSDGQLLE